MDNLHTTGEANKLSAELLERQASYRDVLWKSQQPIIELILNKGLEYYVIREEDSLVRDIFRTDLPVNWGCMDGRFTERRIATAGSGVFWTPEQKLKVVEQVRKAGIKVNKVYRHRDCGAEKAVKQQLIKHGKSEAEAEQIVKEKVENFARYLDASVHWYKPMKHSLYHFERALFLIGTHMFDVTPMAGLYPFQLNVRFSPDIDAVLERINLAIEGIAFGENGPGKDKFKETPFVIGIIGDSQESEYGYDSLLRHLQPLLARYGDLVFVRGFDVPKKLLA